MANNPKTSVASRNLALNAAFDVLNGGYLRIYDGTQPTNCDTALGSQVKLAELTLSATAFAAASNGQKVANAIADDTTADATGTATWGTLVKSDGTTRVQDFSAGTSGCDLNLNSVAIQAGAKVSVTSWTETMAA
jgi:hypothetical protein